MHRVAVIQMNSRDVLEDNLAQAETLLVRAAADGAALAVLPENFAMFAPNVQRSTASRWDEITGCLAAMARRTGLWLVAGSIPSADRPDGRPVPGGRVRSTCLVMDAEGVVRSRYDKIHLFDAEVSDAQSSYRESATFEPGDAVVCVDTPVGRLGLAICYDLRFPELFLALRRQGAELIAVPAAFTRVTGEAHWQILLRARAIESQCYLLGAGQAGVHSGTRETWGHSQVIDPWGRVLAELPVSTPDFCAADCDLVALAELRRQMPLLSHRRLC